MSNKKLFIVSGPSGVGKTTLCRDLAGELNLYYSISTTTRSQRLGESDALDYYFITKAEFEEFIQKGGLLEYAEVHGNYYGTQVSELEKAFTQGQSVIADIDTQGALQVQEKMPEAILIFVMPPSMEVLQQRIESRETDSPEQISKRMEIAQLEMSRREHYNHVIVNDDLNLAKSELLKLIKSYMMT